MEDKIWNCMVKRLNGTETADSKITLDLWLAESELNRKKYKEAKSIWELSLNIQPEEPEKPFHQFAAQLVPKPELSSKRISLFWKYGIAATITALFLMSGLYFYKNNHQSNQEIDWIVKRADFGQMIRINLPDSSKVWLNSGSQISFASTFSSQPSRLVKLIGEAYFEVKHDQKHPFIVKSKTLTTTVYGTSFSIKAYQNESITSIAVNSGKVGVLGADQKNKDLAIMLLPNDQLVYNDKNRSFAKSNIANGDVNSWTKGSLIFEQSPIEEVVQTLERKYNVKIDTAQISGSGCRLTARFNNEPLKAILKALKLSLQIRSTQVGQTIYLKGGNCM